MTMVIIMVMVMVNLVKEPVEARFPHSSILFFNLPLLGTFQRHQHDDGDDDDDGGGGGGGGGGDDDDDGG